MHENRETSRVSPAEAGDRSGKAVSHNPDMHAREESDSAIVPMKLPNNGDNRPGGGGGGKGGGQGERR